MVDDIITPFHEFLHQLDILFVKEKGLITKTSLVLKGAVNRGAVLIARKSTKIN